MKRFLFYLGHPAHYHYISNVVRQLRDKGHRILLVAREKDVLGALLKGSTFDVEMLPARKSGGKTHLIASVLNREVKMARLAKKFSPDLMIGTDIVITHTGKLLDIPTIVMSEDDATVIPQFVRYGYRYASHILAPASCDCSPYNHKQIAYPGYAELAYLHPRYFQPQRDAIDQLYGDASCYFILRLAQLTAFHDKGKKGIGTELARKIVRLLKKKGNVFISSEKGLPEDLEKYKFPLKPHLMHQALYFAKLYIGDSQTMACEAALLGTPFLRFNDFVGKLGYLNELEQKYGLGYGIIPADEEKLLRKISDLMALPGLKKLWASKRQQMLAQCIDTASFMTWLFENYPHSASEWISGYAGPDMFRSSACQ